VAANSLWGSPRILGELCKIGISVAKSTVEKYMVRSRQSVSKTVDHFSAGGMIGESGCT
jgi:hypothetical protein